MGLHPIGLALHLYHDTWHTFPPAYTVDAEGRRLHSWRVLLLPYLDRNDVYEKIDLNKPWDDPVHSELRKTAIAPFICPSNPSLPSRTSYLAVVGDELAFTGEHPQKISDFTDGAGETITVIEVSEGQSIEWMDPHDADEPMFLSFVQTEKTSHTGGGHVLLADGAVRFVSSKTPVETRRALLTRSAHDSVGEF